MKVLICGYNFHTYLNSIAKGFIKNGCNVALFTHPNVSIRKLSIKNPVKRLWAWYKLKKINKGLKKIFLSYRPDMVLCINASSLLPDTISLISENAVSVLWLVDALRRVPTNLSTIMGFKKIFVFEPSDIEEIKRAVFLPYGFDEEIYCKQDIEKIYDISFVGAGHKERYEPLDIICKRCRDKGFRIFVFGPFTLFKKKPLYRKRYPFLYSSLAYNGRLFPEQINRIYNKSWININLHHSQSKKGINPRTFEICGSGNFQLVDNKDAIRTFFNKNELVTYYNIEDLIDKIEHFLKKKQILSSIAEKAYKKAMSQHTFSHRAKYILNHI